MTKSLLRKLVREEIEKILNETTTSSGVFGVTGRGHSESFNLKSSNSPQTEPEEDEEQDDYAQPRNPRESKKKGIPLREKFPYMHNNIRSYMRHH